MPHVACSEVHAVFKKYLGIREFIYLLFKALNAVVYQNAVILFQLVIE